jgi:hypothetical protein
MKTQDPHPHLALLLKQYARDLAQSAPSSHLDARIDRLVADHPQMAAVPPPLHRRRRVTFYAAAAGFAVLAIGAGIFIGMRLEQARTGLAAAQGGAHETLWPPADLTMWPTDSVSFKIPAEYSAKGTLVVVDPDSKHTSTRYWIDVVVSNDGTFRIEQVVPADFTQRDGGHDGIAPKAQ